MSNSAELDLEAIDDLVSKVTDIVYRQLDKAVVEALSKAAKNQSTYGYFLGSEIRRDPAANPLTVRVVIDEDGFDITFDIDPVASLRDLLEGHHGVPKERLERMAICLRNLADEIDASTLD
jgi:hypothetical protein